MTETAGPDRHTRALDAAKDFWRWWQDDPDSDQQLEVGPREAIETTLETTFGVVKDDARLLAQTALDSVNKETRTAILDARGHVNHYERS